MMDEELQKFNEEYLNLGPQYQIPDPELGPLERRVQQTYVDGLLSGEINLKDSEYWFTEPEGLHASTTSRSMHSSGSTALHDTV